MLPGFSARPLSISPSSPLSHQRPRWEPGEAVLGWYLPEHQRAWGGGGRIALIRRHVGLPELMVVSERVAGKQCVYPLSGDDGSYFMVRYIVVESMIQRQRSPDKSPGVCQHSWTRTNLYPCKANGCHPIPLSSLSLCPLCN